MKLFRMASEAVAGKIKTLALLLLLLSLPARAQKNYSPDTALIHRQLQSARDLYNSGKPDSACVLAQRAYALSVKRDYKKGMARALLLVGITMSSKPESRDSVYTIIRTVTAIATGLKDTLLLINAFKLEGHGYFFSQEWNKSMEFYQKALKLAEAIRNKREMAAASRQIGVAYISSGFDGNPIGLKYYERALKLYDEIKDTVGITGMYYVMGIAYNNIGDLEKGKLCQEQLIRFCKMQGDEACVARAQNELAGYYSKIGMTEKALELLRDSYKRLKGIGGYKEEIATTCQKIYMYMAQEKRIAETFPYLQEELSLGIELKNKGLERSANENLVHYYMAVGNNKQALRHALRTIEMLKEANNGELPKQMAEMEAKYQTEKKQAQIEGLEKEKQQQALLTAAEKKRQQIIIISIAGGLALVVVFSFFLYKRFRITQRQARIIAMQKQLVEEKQKELLDSIHYAKRIQRSLLPTDKYIGKKLDALLGPAQNKKSYPEG